MKIALASLLGCVATLAGAQITSVTNPSAYRPDKPASAPTPKRSPVNEPVAVPTSEIPAGELTSEADNQANVLDHPPGPPVAPLNLVCGGSGTANKPSISTYHGSSNASGLVGTDIVSVNGNSSGTITTMRHQDFADQVDVRLFSGDDRIRLPRTILPPIHGGSDGWFELTNVKVTDRAITASAGINFMNHPKVHIDRLTGTISINGKAGSYTGHCEAVDPNAQRKF